MLEGQDCAEKSAEERGVDEAARETRESVASSRADHLGAETRRRVRDKFIARLLELSLLPYDRPVLVAPPLLSDISCKHEQ